MHVQISTDNNIEGRDGLAAHITEVVESTMARFRERITRVEVHLSDQNSEKGGQDDKRCVMEARLQGRQPTAVSHEAATLDQAIEGAAAKLKRTIESAVERMRDHR